MSSSSPSPSQPDEIVRSTGTYPLFICRQGDWEGVFYVLLQGKKRSFRVPGGKEKSFQPSLSTIAKAEGYKRIKECRVSNVKMKEWVNKKESSKRRTTVTPLHVTLLLPVFHSPPKPHSAIHGESSLVCAQRWILHLPRGDCRGCGSPELLRGLGMWL